MSRFPNLPDPTDLSDVFRAFPVGIKPLLEFHDVILREASPLTVAQRELIAAYVSGLNACVFCYGSHRSIAEAYGLDFDLFDQLMEDLEAAPVDQSLKPILAYVRRLTLEPSKVTDEDAAAVFAAGWSEEALYHAIVTCALFNFMNRIIEGTGVTLSQEQLDKKREYWATLTGEQVRARSYTSYGKQLGLFKDNEQS